MDNITITYFSLYTQTYLSRLHFINQNTLVTKDHLAMHSKQCTQYCFIFKQFNGLYSTSLLLVLLGWFVRRINPKPCLLITDYSCHTYKSCGICLTKHIGSISGHQLFIASGHTHTNTHTDFPDKRNQACWSLASVHLV